jgi:hypothetical protein
MDSNECANICEAPDAIQESNAYANSDGGKVVILPAQPSQWALIAWRGFVT